MSEKEVGRVSIRVVPDTKGFRQKAEAGLRKEKIRDVKVKVTPELDDDQLQRDMRKVSDREEKGPRISPEIDDTKLKKHLAAVNKVLQEGASLDFDFNKQVGDLKKSLGKDLKAYVDLEVDTGGVAQQIARASKDARVSVDVDSAGLRAKMQAALRKMQDLQANIQMGVDLSKSGVAKARAAAERAMGGLEARMGLDAGTLAVKARAAAAAASRGLKVTAKMDIDRRSLNAVTAAVGQSARFMARPIYKVFGAEVFEGMIRNFTRIKGVIASVALAASAALVPVAAMGTAMGDAAVAAVKLGGALVPAALTTAALGIAGMAKAFSGFGDAVKATNLDELNAALVNLSPSAQTAARGMFNLKQAFNEASAGAQEAFWSQVKQDLNALTPLAEKAGAAITELSATAGQAANGLAEFVASAEGMDIFTSLLESSKEAAGSLAGAMFNVVPGIMAVGAAAGPVFADLMSKLEGVFTDWSGRMVTGFESGELQAQIQSMVDKMREFWAVVQDVGAIIGGVWSAAAAAGAPFLTSIQDAVSSTREWVESAEGVSTLTGYFESMAGVVSTMAPIFGEIASTILGQVVPAMGSFIEAAGPGMQTFAQGFADLVAQLAPFAPMVGQIFGQIVGWIGQLLPHIAPLVPAIVGVAAAFQGWSVVGPIVSALGTVLAGLSAPMLAIVAVIGLVVAAFMSVQGSFAGLQAAAAPLGTAFQTIWQALVELGQTVWTALQPAFAAIVPVVQNLVGLFADIVAALTPIIQVIFQVVGVIISALIPVFVSLMPAVNAVISIFRSLVNAIAPILAVVAQVAGAFISLLATILGFVGSALGAIISFVAGVIAGFVSMVATVIGAVGGFVSSIVSFFSSMFSGVMSIATSMWSSVVSAFSSGVSRAISFVSQMPGRAKAALGNVGSLLVSSGRALIQGFINGIKAMIGSVRSAASSVVQAARDFFPFSPAKRGPFSGKGYTTYSGKALVTDFAGGMMAAKGSVADAANSVMSAAQDRIHGINKDKILRPVLEKNAEKIAKSREREQKAREEHAKKIAEINKKEQDQAERQKAIADENRKHAEEMAKIRKELDESLEAPDYSEINTSFKEYWVGGLKEALRQDLQSAVKQSNLTGQMRAASLQAIRDARRVMGDHPVFATVEANVNAEHFEWAVNKAIEESEIHEIPINFAVENLKEVKDFFGMGDGVISRAIDAAMEWNGNNSDANNYRKNGKTEVHYHVEDMNEAIRRENLRERQQMMRRR